MAKETKKKQALHKKKKKKKRKKKKKCVNKLFHVAVQNASAL